MKKLLYGVLLATFFAGLQLYRLSKQADETVSQRRGGFRPSQDEMITFLQEYIQIDTSHPQPNYSEAISFLKRQAVADGFEYQELILPSGRPVFVISMQGSDSSLPALVLNHHMDVVPVADASLWVVPPFSGSIHEEALIGRGAQDMKGIAAVHYAALKMIKKSKKRLKRTVYITAVPDEEIGGFTGTGEFIKTDFFKNLHVGFVVDEGHASGSETYLDIKVAERKPIQICVQAAGELAHGSHLLCNNANHRLISFLHNIVMLHQDLQTKTDAFQPGELLSLNITSLQSGVLQQDGKPALNSVPPVACATLDIRVPPTIKKQDVIDLLDGYISKEKEISYTVLAQAQEEPDITEYKTELYNALEAACQKHGLSVKPHFFEASSDLRYYQHKGMVGVGFTPFTVQDNIHGINESVPVDQLFKARDILTTFLMDFCE